MTVMAETAVSAEMLWHTRRLAIDLDGGMAAQPHLTTGAR